ncbi:hypothetical protein DTO013E5_525 [Penicillium roqueforti]|uniref:uncharacterized protein n=1 Tax=Penicillium roqueforti TaxID=5082 RepID=UPI00190D0B17|nr:uncharacterized protein LCP9604111_613 [Penicillium roqueforti]KAF9253087.1 hypothetical protein LCP9604111_613 [Penicillium roqueforti]KAI1838603.1 hypothetical protein CBS147337_328 [Penicillium roqueforti]KAI2723542.1 hypothetical protein CBS147318_473 [Penicillium roqueforti]KAI2746311.1 hypothetical protein DTO012A1_1142 [Penicillium roqueforti]KAI2756961.1 hypothetical protein DTO013F2_376 [Penicillium roqueforti]
MGEFIMADPYANLLVCEPFDWWEDVENDIAMKTQAIPTTPTVPITATELVDKYSPLLTRGQFNWLEDNEDDIAMKTKALVIPTPDTENMATASIGPAIDRNVDDKYAHLLEHEQFDRLEDVENYIAMGIDLATIPSSPATTSKLDDKYSKPPVHQDCLEDDENDTAMDTKYLAIDNEPPATTNGPIIAVALDDSYAHLLHRETSDSVDNAEATLAMDHQPEMAVTMSSNEIIDSPQPVELNQSLDIPNSASTTEPVQNLQLASPQPELDEFNYRAEICNEDNTIHHWNWLGWPVYTRTATPPGVSLAFMQAIPKAPRGRDKLRVNSIMKCAIEYIDPVILKVDRGDEGILQMYGSAMIEACEGLTYTHYSLHGNWMSDDFSMRRRIVPDAGESELERFAIGRFAVANGLLEGGPFISRYEWLDWRDQLVAASKEPVRSPRKRTWKPTPSKLKIESTSSKELSPPSRPLTFSSVPLEIVGNTQKARITTKTIHSSVVFPIGIMRTIMKKTWPVPTTVPNTVFSLPFGSMGIFIEKPLVTFSNIPREMFVFPLGIMWGFMKRALHLIRAAFTPRVLLPETLSSLSD